jgi:IS30 family transposase
MSQNYCHLSLDERRTIFNLLGKNISKTEISQILGRHRSTVFREVRRNSFYLAEDQRCNGYFHVSLRAAGALSSRSLSGMKH